MINAKELKSHLENAIDEINGIGAGTGSGGAYMASNHSGNVKIWIWMDNKQPIA